MWWKRAPPEPRARAKRLAVWPRLALSSVRAGGGKGAAIGAGSGATLGTLGQVFTSGQQVRVPPETRLTFRLQQPLLLN